VVADEDNEQPFVPHQIAAAVSRAVAVGQLKSGKRAAERQHGGRGEHHDGTFLQKDTPTPL